MHMKKITLFLVLTFGTFYASTAQEISLDDLMGEIESEEAEPAYLPEKMLFTQRVFWGENGLYRKVGFAPKELTAESRQRELKARRTMFKIHQATGFLAAAGMIGQAILGPKLYKDGTNFDVRKAHKGVALGTNIAYGTTALMALMSPPPMVNRKKFDNIKLHKLMAITHFTGMIATNVLAHKASAGKVDKKWHRAAAIGTFAVYTASIVTIKLEF